METYKYLGILEADTIKQVDMKGKIIKSISDKRKNFPKPSSTAEISSKGKTLVRYSRPFLKYSREELPQMYQRTKQS